jgi:hypothetical protein
MKLRADRITNTELDQRLGAVAKGQANDRERLRKLEAENAELRETVAALTPKPQLLPDGHYLREGEVYDRLGNHAGILDQGNFVLGVPLGSSVLDDGRVVSACRHAWHRGRIIEGAYVDEPDVQIAKAQAETAAANERCLASTLKHNAEWAEREGKAANSTPDTVDAVKRSHAGHHDWLVKQGMIDGARSS